MTLVDYLAEADLPHWPIFAHLHRHGLCSSNCTGLHDIASPDHAACIAHLRSLNPRHLSNILAKHTPCAT